MFKLIKNHRFNRNYKRLIRAIEDYHLTNFIHLVTNGYVVDVVYCFKYVVFRFDLSICSKKQMLTICYCCRQVEYAFDVYANDFYNGGVEF